MYLMTSLLAYAEKNLAGRPAHVVLRNFWSKNAVQGQFHEYLKSGVKQLGC
ncbi:hypothetical protein TUM17564_41710 [Citrobacter freundii]|nr:hypothetical protein TUM17564_41710 [Citrobacter freundii]